ncbi:MAG TPA: glycosyltransferase [Bacteroidales bacterium]|jgi:glycosyltransferase involved in cell wall biosynthesis|nr:glycosyltransferase family 4 protein [Bacteroidales bacterium]HPY67087.1 glycosyltransferase [Bacteroidales bacterium]
MKKNILFINQNQFGYHITYYKYCKNLVKDDYNITFLCWDYGRTRISIDGIKVYYSSRNGNIIQRNIRFIKQATTLIRRGSFDVVFVKYFRGCFLLPLLCSKKQYFHLDIVTGGISKNDFKRSMYNHILKFESRFFNNVSTISEGLKSILKLSDETKIFPLGADPVHVQRIPKARLSLLYVGVLSSRNIIDTVEGVRLFLKDHPSADIHYTIIGGAWNNEADELKSKIERDKLENVIELHGYIPHNNLINFYANANAGVSYIPVKPWYEFQPATKTFEYLMAGMPVIATSTCENRRVINSRNGLLIDDNAISFSEALGKIYDNIGSYDEEEIRESVSQYRWEKLVSNLKAYLSDIEVV